MPHRATAEKYPELGKRLGPAEYALTADIAADGTASGEATEAFARASEVCDRRCSLRPGNGRDYASVSARTRPVAIASMSMAWSRSFWSA